MKDTNHKIFGYEWSDIQAMQRGTYKQPVIRHIEGNDYGHNGKEADGLFTLVPSGDRVTFGEMRERLNK